MSPSDAPLRPYLGAFIDALVKARVRDVCFCPGSRSSPLLLLLHEHPEIRLWSLLDERGAGFFALGMAKSLRQSVAVLTTSGTAAANLLPAVTEAHHARIPLLVLTADRPGELREVGSLQTVDQVRLFGSRVRWFQEMLLPEATTTAMRHARWVAVRAVELAQGETPGPVHLNFPLREPLIPEPADSLVAGEDPEADREGEYRSIHGVREPSPEAVESLARELGSSEKGLIVCGPQDDPRLAPAVTRLSQATGFPILADVLSQVRCGDHYGPRVMDAYDSYLRDSDTADELRPDMVIRLGEVPVSKPLQAFLAHHRESRQITVIGHDGWTDPGLSSQTVLRADPPPSLNLLSQELASPPRPWSSWARTWQRLDSSSRERLHLELMGLPDLSEPRLALELGTALPDGATVFVGNSMPVRDLDSFFPGSTKKVRFLGNRGASGIDGVVSSALGVAASGAGPLVAVLGDLSFYHDLNGLLAARRHGLDATIVLVNNDGGGIFSFLPQADLRESRFEELFGTPHGLDFGHAAALFDVRYRSIETWEQFRQELGREVSEPGTGLLEIRTGRGDNKELHRRLWRTTSDDVVRDGTSSL